MTDTKKTSTPPETKEAPKSPPPENMKARRETLVLVEAYGGVSARKLVSAPAALADTLVASGAARAASDADLAVFARKPIAIS